jgi:hypothetical protein
VLRAAQAARKPTAPCFIRFQKHGRNSLHYIGLHLTLRNFTSSNKEAGAANVHDQELQCLKRERNLISSHP